MKSELLFFNLAFFILATLITNQVISQSVLQVDWHESLSNSNGASEMDLSQIEALNGQAFVAGSSSTPDGQRMYLASRSNSGTLDWELNLPTGSSSSIERLVLYNNDLYVAGEEQSSGSPVQLARIDQSGTIIWQISFDADGGEDVELSWMEVVNDRIYIVGSELGANDYPTAWAAEFDLQGNLNWTSSFDPGVNTVFTDINVNALGEIAACGWADFGGSYLLVGFTPEGDIDWQYPESFTGFGDKWFNDLTSDETGNWIAHGSIETGDFFEYDAVTYKFDSEGNELWNTNINTGGETFGALVELAPNGNIITFSNIEIDFDRAIRISAYNSDGDEQWTTDYSVESNTTIANAIISENNTIYMGAQDFDFNSFVKFSDDGDLLDEEEYEYTQFDYLEDIAIDQSNFYGAGNRADGGESITISLQKDDLNEVYAEYSTGIPSSDFQVGELINSSEFIWTSNTSFQGSTNVFSITKLDTEGNVLWTQDKELAGSNPKFDILTVDESGNSIGFFESLVNGGVTDLGLVKYDPDGNEVFYTVFDSSQTLLSGAITTDLNNNIYVGGYNQNSKLMFLTRLDPNGNQVWTTHYQSASTSFPYAEPQRMEISEQEKLVIGGVHKNGDNVNNLYLFQYDLNGNLEWESEVANHSGNNTNLAGFYVNSQGEITIFGSSGTSLNLIAKHNPQGNQLWIETEETSAAGADRCMAMDQNENAYLCFSSNSEARFLKVDANGSPQESGAYSIDGQVDFYFPQGASIIDGQLAVLGDFGLGLNSVPFEMVLNDDLTLVSGNIDSETQGDFRAMATNEQGKIHAAFTQGESQAGPGLRTTLLRQYSIGTLDVENGLNKTAFFAVFPNPAKDHLNIRFNEKLGSVEQIKLLDMSGRTLLDRKSKIQLNSEYVYTLDLSIGLSTGMYILSISTLDAVHSIPLIIDQN